MRSMSITSPSRPDPLPLLAVRSTRRRVRAARRARLRRPPAPPVTAAKALARDVTEWNEFTGRLEAVHHVDVRPRVSGLIASVRFTEGAIVQRGDVLFEIDPRPFQAEVDRLRADLARAKAAFARATAERERARAAVGRERDLRRGARPPARRRPPRPKRRCRPCEAALRAAELNLEFTHGDRADRRPRRPRHRHRGQPGVERAR